MSSEAKLNLPFTAAQWDSLRFRFEDSIMADTELFKLAQNVGVNWPIRGKDETPRKYIGLSLDELLDLTEFFGKSNRLPLLFSILNETIAFDDPFCEMIEQLDVSARKENPAIKSLQKLEVPLDFPVPLANFSPETQTFCQAEEIEDIAGLLSFAQKMAKTIVVGGDFRSFLNALTHLDTITLQRYLPIRDGKTGLFLAESIGHLASQLDPAEAVALLQLYEFAYSKPAWLESKPIAKTDLPGLITELKELAHDRFQLLPDQAQQLRHAAQSGQNELLRYFAPLRDPDTETLAHAISLAVLDIKPKPSGLIKRIFSR